VYDVPVVAFEHELLWSDDNEVLRDLSARYAPDTWPS